MMLTVGQKVWQTHVGQPKTEARQGAVPVIPALKKILDDYPRLFRQMEATLFSAGRRKDLR